MRFFFLRVLTLHARHPAKREVGLSARISAVKMQPRPFFFYSAAAAVVVDSTAVAGTTRDSPLLFVLVALALPADGVALSSGGNVSSRILDNARGAARRNPGGIDSSCSNFLGPNVGPTRRIRGWSCNFSLLTKSPTRHFLLSRVFLATRLIEASTTEKINKSARDRPRRRARTDENPVALGVARSRSNIHRGEFSLHPRSLARSFIRPSIRPSIPSLARPATPSEDKKRPGVRTSHHRQPRGRQRG